MVGFIGPSGRQFSDSQRRAMFIQGNFSPRSGFVVARPQYDKDNRFAIGASLLAAGVGKAAVGTGVGASLAGAGGVGLGTGVGVSLAGAGAGLAGAGLGSAAAGATSVAAPAAAANVASKLLGGSGSTKTAVGPDVSGAASGAASAANRPISAGVSSAADEFLGIGEPYTPTSSELMQSRVDGFGFPAVYSKEPTGHDVDIEKVRWALKKQYPDADVDTKVTMLPPDKYMETALRENPGREDEALKSNGFYSPKDDKTYLEIDTDGLNTVRAMIHEFVHDMSDDGVGDDMLNEGYADYVAYRVMVDELNIPETRARLTLGYPEEERKIERMVDSYGRKKVDEAFLKDHSLGALGIK